jgi:hypothetical protein
MERGGGCVDKEDREVGVAACMWVRPSTPATLSGPWREEIKEKAL